MPQVVFEPYGVSVEVESGAALLDAARCGGVRAKPECSPKGTHAKCRVDVVRGDVESGRTRQESCRRDKSSPVGPRWGRCQLKFLCRRKAGSCLTRQVSAGKKLVRHPSAPGRLRA